MRADEEARSRIPGNLEARQNGDFTFCGIDGRDGRVARDIATADRSLQFKVAHRRLRLLPQVPMKSPPGPPATRGSTAAAHLRLIVWCKDCRHQAEPDPAEMAERYGAKISVPDWAARLVCGRCGSRRVSCRRSRYRRQSLFSVRLGARQILVHVISL
jgi:hypothetical protein